MSVKANRLKSDIPEESSLPKTAKSKKSIGVSVNSLQGLTDFFKDEKTQFIIGLSFLLLSFYFLFAFTSFIFTWKADYSEVNKGMMEFLSADVKVANWLGKFGALISHLFINNWFGLASFVFILLLAVSGFRIAFNITLLPIQKTFKNSIFLLFLVSTGFGYMFDLHWLGGTFGYYASQYLINVLGSIGTGLLLFFIAASFVVLSFKLPFRLKERVPKDLNEEEDSSEPTTLRNPVKSNILTPPVKSGGSSNGEIENEIKIIKRETPVVPATAPVVNPNITLESEKQSVTDIDKPKGPVFEVLSVEAESDTIKQVVSSGVPSVSLSEEEEETEEEDEDDEDGDLEIDEDEDWEGNEEEGEIEADEEFDNPDIALAETSHLPLSIEKPEEEVVQENGALIETPMGEFDPKLELSSYQFPVLDLLENYGSSKIQVDREELEENKNKIVETLGHYNIDIDKIKATIGPTVTLYEIVPKAGVRISKIKNLEDDIALSLSALGIRIIAPIPGKGTIGIEVPNQKPEVVSMRSILASEKFQNVDMELPIALGKTISNEIFITDLSKMPHLLMAGATGQGKSVGLNAILVSLLYKKHPSQVKFVLVDPKKVELTLFKKIERHFLAKLPGEEEAIITDTKKVINTLNSLCIEMDQRYDLLKEAQVRNIKEYNAKFIARKLNPQKGHHFLPYIVLVVDEFADLIMTAGKEVEMPIARLAQLARAVGIHLIIATQRPSVNIITGTIKANFPARIAFRVTSKIDSRTILDAGGADQLIGRGDMLLSTGADLIRIQCAFVDTPEVEKITDFIGSQRGYASAFLLPEYVEEGSAGNSDFNAAERDAYFEDAARIIVQNQQGSASLLQRRLKLGYNRAGRIIDQLEAAGVIGPFEGSKAREVLIHDELSLEEFLSKIK